MSALRDAEVGLLSPHEHEAFALTLSFDCIYDDEDGDNDDNSDQRDSGNDHSNVAREKIQC